MSNGEDDDFTKLPLTEKLDHKSWKARSQGYQELRALFQDSGQDDSILTYWKDPELFARYVTDSNVAAQEQAILALEVLLREVKLPARGADLKSIMSLWIPALVEKGLPSARSTTKSKSMECILLLCAYDESITLSVQLVLPFFAKKLPKLVAASINCVTELIESYQFVNVDTNLLLPEILEPVAKLASHADKNVRAQTMLLIVAVYTVIGRDRNLIQALLLDQLKPIQQNDLQKLFSKADGSPDAQPKLVFRWQDNKEVDKDGDTLMDMKNPIDQLADGSTTNKATKLSQTGSNNVIDPFDLLSEQTILDKLPNDFREKVNSVKWKDRVEALQEFWDSSLSKAKKLKSKNQDYTELLSILAHILQKDANVQAVTIAAQCIQAICEKLRVPGFTKHYVTIVFVPLLERTKEKKLSVIESIRNALKCICRFYNPLSPSGHNEDLLQEVLQCMKHKIPQIRMESTTLLTFLITQLNANEIQVLRKYLDDEIVPTVLKIVNDTQPAIRNSGFECYANLIRALGKKELNGPLETLDNLKKKKIEDYLKDLPPIQSLKDEVTVSKNSGSGHLPRASSPAAHLSTIPTKRGPSSPLQKITKSNSPSTSRSRVLLTSRSLATPQQINNNAPKALTTLPREMEQFRREKQEWIQERRHLLNQVNNLTNFQTDLSNENDSLREQLKILQTNLHEKGLLLRSKELQLSKLQDRILQLETDLRQQQQQHQQQQTQRQTSSSEASAISTNLGVRSLSSSSFDPTTTRSKHFRTPSESSDDLPRRVDSLQLNNEIVNEESWKRAAEVTSQLKARIERMRAKTKGINNNA